MSKLTKGYGSTGIQEILGAIKTYFTTILADYATTASVTSAISTKADLVDGKVADEQIPDSAHDVETYDDVEDFPLEGLVGKIYYALSTGVPYTYNEEKDEYTVSDTGSSSMAPVTIDNTDGEEYPVSVKFTLGTIFPVTITSGHWIGISNTYTDAQPYYLGLSMLDALEIVGKSTPSTGDIISMYKYDGITRFIYTSNGTDYDVSSCIAQGGTFNHDQYLIADSNQTFNFILAGPYSASATLSVIKGGSYKAIGGNVQPDWNQTNATADDYIKNKPTLATVATSGSYNDLNDKPTVPAWTKLGDVTGTSPDYEDSSTFNLSALQNKDVLMIFSVDEGSLTAKQGIITLEYSAFEFGKILEDSVQEEDEITRLWKGFYGGAPRESVATFEEFLRSLGYIYIATHSTTAEIGAKIYGGYDWTLEIYTK